LRLPVTTGREEVGSEASTRVRRAAAAALAGAAFLVGAAVAMADPGPAPPPPPPNTGGSSSPSTTPGSTRDTTPPPRVSGLHISAPKPGRMVLSWTLVNPSDVAHVFVLRKSGGHCPTLPVRTNSTQHIGVLIGSLGPRTHEVDTTEHDRTTYCYAVFTLDAAGNWASPVTDRVRNPGDVTAPTAVTDVRAVLRQGGGVTLTWTNPSDAARVLVIRELGVCPSVPSDGQRVGSTLHRSSQVDTAAQPGSTYCYGVFAFDEAGNRSPVATTPIDTTQPSTPTANATPPGQSGSSGSSLPDLVGIIGGGAIVLAGLAYATLRVVRREWEWHSRTGYGIRDLMSVDVRDYDRTALVIPAIIGVCIAGALVVLLMSL
jgi:hypothetical protein